MKQTDYSEVANYSEVTEPPSHAGLGIHHGLNTNGHDYRYLEIQVLPKLVGLVDAVSKPRTDLIGVIRICSPLSYQQMRWKRWLVTECGLLSEIVTTRSRTSRGMR